MSTSRELKQNYGPAVRLALISLLLCGLVFPLAVTGIAQVLLPFQANGSIATFNGTAVGSNLISQNFTLPVFFHPRNDSASRVDPDITLADAISQIPRIHNATGIPSDALQQIVDQNTEGTAWIFGSPYVNVLRLNLILIQKYPTFYAGFPKT